MDNSKKVDGMGVISYSQTKAKKYVTFCTKSVPEVKSFHGAWK